MSIKTVSDLKAAFGSVEPCPYYRNIRQQRVGSGYYASSQTVYTAPDGETYRFGYNTTIIGDCVAGNGEPIRGRVDIIRTLKDGRMIAIVNRKAYFVSDIRDGYEIKAGIRW